MFYKVYNDLYVPINTVIMYDPINVSTWAKVFDIEPDY